MRRGRFRSGPTSDGVPVATRIRNAGLRAAAVGYHAERLQPARSGPRGNPAKDCERPLERGSRDLMLPVIIRQAINRMAQIFPDVRGRCSLGRFGLASTHPVPVDRRSVSRSGQVDTDPRGCRVALGSVTAFTPTRSRGQPKPAFCCYICTNDPRPVGTGSNPRKRVRINRLSCVASQKSRAPQVQKQKTTRRRGSAPG